ncbi:exonuclease domain-containing protein [Agromyces archimandritae]|uniref:DNA polymerase III subunit epsilon n=1 Tax=Agromyces archimandritae TaxID=2781962 RepID=A0A975FPI5_9MICO|nr:exonuclease domain-containing protein [Agromyces archimandritae]QTX05652.1 DNA polymerase III subunit epsilon [Agromyces archimandritae]
MPGFAVIDFETTGLMPGGSDRVVEVAVVHVNEAGRITGEWETLVNPGRDVGAERIHGIRGADVMHAPRFEQVAGRLIELLAGRVIVAHNASFDLRFLDAELRRAGYAAPELAELGLCTMRLARELIPGAGRSLADCCAAFDIDLDGAHRASVDAAATARLLGEYLQLADAEFWLGRIDHASSVEWMPWPAAPSAAWIARGTAPTAGERFLERITAKLPEHAGPAEHQDYLALLDRCLLDRHISAHEAEALVDAAETLGISRNTCLTLHERYFDDLARVAWADGVLTADEIADLASVVKLLSVSDARLVAAMQAPASPSPVDAGAAAPSDQPSFSLAPGDHIVLTGEMSLAREIWFERLTAAGYVPRPAVTKRVKLVVAADPDSLSGKARKARDYGIPIVGEPMLARLVGV